MDRRSFILTAGACTSALLEPSPARAQFIKRLQPQTNAAFDSYVRPIEAAQDWRPHLNPKPDGSVTFAPGAADPNTKVDDGLIHDWAAAAIAPGVAVERVIRLLQDYDDYKLHYAPNVTDSKLLDHNGSHWRVFLKLYKKKILTARFDTEYDIEYRAVKGDWAVISRSTKIAELDGAMELPPGTGHGYLWRLNTYWVLAPRPDGAYIECRAISLSRDVPPALGWAVRPMLTSVPRESLGETMEATVRDLRT